MCCFEIFEMVQMVHYVYTLKIIRLGPGARSSKRTICSKLIQLISQIKWISIDNTILNTASYLIGLYFSVSAQTLWNFLRSSFPWLRTTRLEIPVSSSRNSLKYWSIQHFHWPWLHIAELRLVKCHKRRDFSSCSIKWAISTSDKTWLFDYGCYKWQQNFIYDILIYIVKKNIWLNKLITVIPMQQIPSLWQWWNHIRAVFVYSL